VAAKSTRDKKKEKKKNSPPPSAGHLRRRLGGWSCVMGAMLAAAAMPTELQQATQKARVFLIVFKFRMCAWLVK
jgi:hypothetical protein